MTRRIVVGNRGGASGVWVSKPGHDALTTSEDNMLLSTATPCMQIVASGVINSPSDFTDYDVAIPNLGFTPIVLTGGSYIVAYSFPNATTLRLRAFSKVYGAMGGPGITWAVTNQRIMH